MRLLPLLLLALGGVSCTGEDAGHWIQPLGWDLADGRSCSDSGVVDVVVSGASASEQLFRCDEGQDQLVEITLERRPAELTLEGRSMSGALLYRGQATCRGDGPKYVLLRFVGGES